MKNIFTSDTGQIEHEGPDVAELTDDSGADFKVANGSKIATVLLKKTASNSGSLYASSFDVILKENTIVNSYSFTLHGKQQGSPVALTSNEIDKINVKEVLDLKDTGTIGVQITSELFNPSNNPGGYTSHDSQTRHIYNSSPGIILSKKQLAVGSDLRGHSVLLTPADDINGPDFTLVNHSDLALEENEVVVGVHRTISGYSNTGFEIIISSPANTSQKRLLAVDNDGTPLELEANSTIGSEELRFQLLELTTGIDLNSDNINGFTINKSDVINQGLQNDLNRRISLSTNDTILLSKEMLPIGDLTGSNLNSSLLRYDNWNGPGVIVLADSNGVSPFKTEANQTLLGARIVRNEEHAPLSPPKVERAELFVSKNNTTEVIKFSLDGTNNGIATYAGSDVSTEQINLISLETSFNLSGDNSDNITVKSVLYIHLQLAVQHVNRTVAETLSGEIVLSRENASVGTVVRETINNQKPIILADNNGIPINSTTLNSASSSKVLGARTIVFQPKGWQSEISNDATSPIGYNLYVESISDENSVDVLSFGADGRQVSLSTLNLGELLSAEVSENLDLNNDDLIGGDTKFTFYSAGRGK